MRLVDADELFDEVYREYGALLDEGPANWFMNRINDASTIDPIHAAGGCYCRECKHSSESGGYENAEQAETHVNCLKFLTPYHRVSIMPKDGFCSYGERKGRERRVIGRGPEYKFYDGIQSDDNVRYEIVKDGSRGNRTAGTKANMTTAAFAAWAKAEVDA